MTKPITWAAKAAIAVLSAILLTQIEVGYYGPWANLGLALGVSAAAFALGWWGAHDR